MLAKVRASETLKRISSSSLVSSGSQNILDWQATIVRARFGDDQTVSEVSGILCPQVSKKFYPTA
jgi:hypothetical protein